MPKRILILSFSALLAGAPLAAEPPAVAVVASLAGGATVEPPAMRARPARLFDWLPAGSSIEAGPGSAVVLAFINGKRWELRETAKARLAEDGLGGISGAARELPPLPPMPRLAALAPAARAGTRSGAIRIRGERIRDLHPPAGTMVPAGGLTLRFTPREDASRYGVEIEDETGAVVFKTEASSPPVQVAAGILRPGARYRWRVKTLDRIGPAVRGEGDFHILPAEDAERLAALREALAQEGGAGALALLAAIDRRCGLAADLQAAPRQGVVVEDVTPGAAAAKAGLQPDDWILSWSREGARGEIASPFDLTGVEIEQAPRGPVILAGRRGSEEARWTLPAGEWGLSVRPSLQEGLGDLYRQGTERRAAGAAGDAAARWRDAAGEAKKSANGWLAAWFLARAGRVLAAVPSWHEADEAFTAAIAEADRAGQPSIAAQLLWEWGETFRKRNEWARAEDCYRRALTIRESLAPESLEVAASLNSLGNVAARRGDLSAENLYRRALALRGRLAPGSLDFATSLNNLGNLLSEQGDLAAAEDLYRRALAINEQLVPGSLHVARNFNNLGIVASNRGNLAVAEDYHRRALAIREKLAPGGLLVAASLINLGAVALRRGDLAVAEELYRLALELSEKLAPESLDVAWALNNLGLVAYERRDLETAEKLQRRALAIKEKLAPGTSEVAASLSNLGNIAAERREFSTAEELYQRALALDEKLEPQGLDLASTLNNLGAIALDRDSPAAAEGFYRRALAIREKLTPSSSDEAQSLQGLGAVYRRMGKAGLALDAWRRAIEALEAQNARLGGTEEARSAFGVKYADYYRQTVDLLLELRQPDEALHILERSRARSLLALLAERDLAFAGDLSPEIARERRRNGAEYDRTQEAIGRLKPGRDGAEIERLLGRLRELRAEREEIVAKIRETSPRFASLQYPQPLDLAGVRRALDAGTVLLAYSVGEEKTVLFVVQPLGSAGPGLSVFTVSAGRETLTRQVEAFRRLIERREDADLPALATAAADLYRLLVAPAEALISPARRLLISPDGPLQSLPFAALARGDGRPLIEWKPLHTVVSSTVYAELTRSRRQDRQPPPVTLAAFGDPRYPSSTAAQAERATEPELRSVLLRGIELEPLPATRREVEGIAGLFPRGTATYLGAEATEERAKSLGRGVRYLHFACHGLLDERFPLNSALALTIPERLAEGRDNGLLQAWEIFEQMRIDADLVTLSACDTALGKEMGGEGLVGLVRAFQYAGARSVLASLWGVADDSTAELMRRFYGHLKAGKPKDEALRAAQLEVLRRPGLAHPFHWGAFVVIGDWR